MSFFKRELLSEFSNVAFRSSFHWYASFHQILSHKYFRHLSFVTLALICFGFSSQPHKFFSHVLLAVRKWFLVSLATLFLFLTLDDIQVKT